MGTCFFANARMGQVWSSPSLQRATILFKFKALRGKFTTLKIEKSIITKMTKHKLRRESDHKERTNRPKARQQHPKAKGRSKHPPKYKNQA